ncbi:RES domain-containing protein [Methylobacterium sp. NEAU 140]|uniref:RES family NAD+ phosphorylase n=1 Tax=Methylobacterium sp. NEAU 140 TaxID=3064945 RepID=UPI00273732AA|nr:RES domain-containing protein [Methylobacterium sp. NEAU 140]MDP4022250.1 RES domain-containing protein [Methylobacterium sp. NEAU 140]
MTAQRLPHVQKAYRIGDPAGEHSIFDAAGAALYPGRWNTPSSPIIYTSADYGTAMLEKLVHGSGFLPPNQHYIEIILSVGLSYEAVNLAALPGWDLADGSVSKAYGETWFHAKRSLLLFVPSVVARVAENILINPTHPEFGRVSHSRHIPVAWDNRLFKPADPGAEPDPALRQDAVTGR